MNQARLSPGTLELSLIAITTRRKPVIGTEFGVGQHKGLRAMGATMQYLSHKGLCEGSPDLRNSGHCIDGF